jgi:hypothetical protein
MGALAASTIVLILFSGQPHSCLCLKQFYTGMDVVSAEFASEWWISDFLLHLCVVRVLPTDTSRKKCQVVMHMILSERCPGQFSAETRNSSRS